MPRIRSIKPMFWDDIKLSKVSRDVRLLFIGTWTYADDLGVIIADPVWLKSKIFPYDILTSDELEKWLRELVAHKFLLPFVFKGENFYIIRNFNKHQRIDKPNNDDIFIDNHEVRLILEQSRNNRGTIQESSLINIISIDGGEDRIGEDRIGVEGIKKPPEKIVFSMSEIYYKSWETYKQISNGQAKHLTEEIFNEWKELVVFVNTNGMGELFDCKFINPDDFGRIRKDFPKEKWEPVLKKILSTGVKKEHNLYFRIPEFIKYGERGNKPVLNPQPKIKV